MKKNQKRSVDIRELNNAELNAVVGGAGDHSCDDGLPLGPGEEVCNEIQ